jgi:hypothetical protein
VTPIFCVASLYARFLATRTWWRTRRSKEDFKFDRSLPRTRLDSRGDPEISLVLIVFDKVSYSDAASESKCQASVPTIMPRRRRPICNSPSRSFAMPCNTQFMQRTPRQELSSSCHSLPTSKALSSGTFPRSKASSFLSFNHPSILLASNLASSDFSG